MFKSANKFLFLELFVLDTFQNSIEWGGFCNLGTSNFYLKSSSFPEKKETVK